MLLAAAPASPPSATAADPASPPKAVILLPSPTINHFVVVEVPRYVVVDVARDDDAFRYDAVAARCMPSSDGIAAVLEDVDALMEMDRAGLRCKRYFFRRQHGTDAASGDDAVDSLMTLDRSSLLCKRYSFRLQRGDPPPPTTCDADASLAPSVELRSDVGFLLAVDRCSMRCRRYRFRGAPQVLPASTYDVGRRTSGGISAQRGGSAVGPPDWPPLDIFATAGGAPESDAPFRFPSGTARAAEESCCTRKRGVGTDKRGPRPFRF